MFSHFRLRHIPALLIASTTTFGGMWPLLFSARSAMLEFGLPERIANTAVAAPVFVVGNARTTVIGLLTFLFYSRRQLDVVDTIMAVTGLYCGLVDSYVVWREGNPSYAVFRLISSGLISAWGVMGMTAGR
ncbi:hypothetical protein HD806DRAFT_41940 [Xylariaceae sp. AK1471]|nr:hypothetical protein HD806DRAFT_41940 [Xylariaceae sp. AK1471]